LINFNYLAGLAGYLDYGSGLGKYIVYTPGSADYFTYLMAGEVNAGGTGAGGYDVGYFIWR
jgi:hypothetical protein